MHVELYYYIECRILNFEQNVNGNWANFYFKHPQNAVMQVTILTTHT